MRINIIAAVAKNRGIGLDNKLLYWLPNDLKRFKALTTGHTIIMGRTYDQLCQDLAVNGNPAVINVLGASIYGMNDFTHICFFDIPCFNSNAIEFHFLNIPNLSECFLYFNDDALSTGRSVWSTL